MFKPILVTLSLLPLLASATARDVVHSPRIRQVDATHLSAGANLAKYKSVLVKPTTVTFSKNWDPRRYGTFGLKPERVEKIRSEMAELSTETFSKVLTNGAYALATAPAPDALEVQVDITELYVNAPEEESSTLSRTYVRSAGKMRVNITLRDSASGEELLRTSDFRFGDETDRLEWASDVYNRFEAQTELTRVALQLRRMLEKLSK